LAAKYIKIEAPFPDADIFLSCYINETLCKATVLHLLGSKGHSTDQLARYVHQELETNINVALQQLQESTVSQQVLHVNLKRGRV